MHSLVVIPPKNSMILGNSFFFTKIKILFILLTVYAYQITKYSNIILCMPCHDKKSINFKNCPDLGLYLKPDDVEKKKKDVNPKMPFCLLTIILEKTKLFCKLNENDSQFALFKV